jgi:putative transposase
MGYQKYQPERYKRKSLRLKGRDYSAAGAYFITIRTYQYERFLEIPKLRYILLEVWKELPQLYPHVTLDEFVIMPDHIHFILWLDGTKPDLPLGSVVGAFKSITTVRWLQHLKDVGKDMEYPCHLWQFNYNDRIIRQGALEPTRQYIRNNPKKIYPGNNPDVG